jgi:two-component system, NtrC family, response regulator AtoC
MAYSILILDDEELTLRTISRALNEDGYEVFTALSGEEALRIFTEEHPDIVLADIVLPGIDGVEVLRTIRQQEPQTIVVMMSAYGMVERAVEAMKLGAFDYLVKPFHIADMIATVERASEVLSLRVRLRDHVQSAKGRYDFGNVVTRSAQMQQTLDLARRAAESDRTTILILGESGTGKGVLARAIHYNSPRAAMPLVELNCAALPDTLLESELFGFEPGAFTDARRRKEGLVERAHNGTLFLDEIGNMSASVQAKLLRVLEEGTFMRLGGTRQIKVDTRVIAATNANLKQAVSSGSFREDLFYRLNVVPVYIPPLRERKEDIMPLAIDMVRKFNADLKKQFTGFSPAAAEVLTEYPWPGNIRELRNVVERTMILAPEGEIDASYLPEEVRDYTHEQFAVAAVAGAGGEDGGRGEVLGDRKFPTLRDVEERYINEVLNATGNNKTHAARILGIHPTSILRRMKRGHE